MSEKEPEQILGQIFDLLRELEKVKVKTEWPIPVVRDRQGKSIRDYTLRDWMLKCHEEDLEFFNEAMGLCGFDEPPAAASGDFGHYDEARRCLIEEFCDMIHVRFSMIHQFGITPEEIEAGLHNSNVKSKERGCI